MEQLIYLVLGLLGFSIISLYQKIKNAVFYFRNYINSNSNFTDEEYLNIREDLIANYNNIHIIQIEQDILMNISVILVSLAVYPFGQYSWYSLLILPFGFCVISIFNYISQRYINVGNNLDINYEPKYTEYLEGKWRVKLFRGKYGRLLLGILSTIYLIVILLIFNVIL